MVRVILSSSCIGKSYLAERYKNVYDFDQHFLSVKYNREDYPHLTDEEFKGLPGRKVKPNWRRVWHNKLVKFIKEEGHKYDVITVAVGYKVAKHLSEQGIRFEVVHPDLSLADVYKSRALARGNNNISVRHTVEYLRHTNENFRRLVLPGMTKYKLLEPIYLEQFLLETGTTLIPKDDNVVKANKPSFIAY